MPTKKKSVKKEVEEVEEVKVEKKKPVLLEIGTYISSSGNKANQARLQVEADVAGITEASFEDWDKLLKQSLNRAG